MLRHPDRRIAMLAAVIAAAVAGLVACGIKGPLQPPPKAAAPQKPAAPSSAPPADPAAPERKP